MPKAPKGNPAVFVETVRAGLASLTDTRLVLSTDPGLASGMALLGYTQDGEPLLIASAEFHWIEGCNVFEHLLEILDAWDVQVVMEKFTITQKTAQNTQAPWSLKSNGAMEWLSVKYGRPFTYQTPHDSMSKFTNADLKKLGTWHVGGEGHALEAIRHGLLFMNRAGWVARALLN